jgi:hypothetical protein
VSSILLLETESQLTLQGRQLCHGLAMPLLLTAAELTSGMPVR